MLHFRPRYRRLNLRAAAALLAGVLGACAASPGATPGTAGAASPEELRSTVGAYLAAQHAISVGDVRRASFYLDRVLESDPDNASLRRRAFLLRLEAGEFDAAAALADEMAGSPGEGASIANLFLAVEHARRGDFTASLAQVDQFDDRRINQVL